MPLYAVAEILVGPVCPSQSDLDELSGDIASGFKIVGVRPSSLAICAFRESLGANVILVGLWLGEMAEETHRLIVPCRSLAAVGLSVSLGEATITTTAKGTYNAPGPLNADFTCTAVERLSVSAPGSTTALEARGGASVDAGVLDEVITVLVGNFLGMLDLFGASVSFVPTCKMQPIKLPPGGPPRC